MENKAVLFFSRDGSTRIAAELLSERLKARLVELVEEKPSRNFIKSGYRASTQKHSRLGGDPWKEIEDCRTVFIGSPIWAGKGNPAVNGFLDRAELTGKKVFLFTLQADPDKSKSAEVMAHYTRRISEAGGTVEGTLAIQGAPPGKTADRTRLKETLDGWKLP